MNLKVYNIQGSEVGKVSLDEALQGYVNEKVVAQAVAMYRNNLRIAVSNTKTRGEVSGGGKKPWKQKHTGRARAGSNRSPIWRGGGVTFGPRPRKVGYRLPQAIRSLALVECLKGKIRDEEVVVVDQIQAEQPKTKTFAGLAKAFAVSKKSVIVLGEPNEATFKSLRNLPQFSLRRAENLNAFDLVNAQKVLITQEALEQLQLRVKESVKEETHASSN